LTLLRGACGNLCRLVKQAGHLQDM